MDEISIEKARARLGDYVSDAQSGSPVLITRSGKPAAMLVPPGRLTSRERDFIARARRLAFAGTGMPELREITGSLSDVPETVRAEALGVAQVLLLELVVAAERLAGDRP